MPTFENSNRDYERLSADPSVFLFVCRFLPICIRRSFFSIPTLLSTFALYVYMQLCDTVFRFFWYSYWQGSSGLRTGDSSAEIETKRRHMRSLSFRESTTVFVDVDGC